jgi:hypothetical protein
MYFVRKAINSFFALLLLSLLITREFGKILHIKELDAIDRLIRTKSDSEEILRKIIHNLSLD